MLFSGITFLYYFLPFTALYFIIPKKWRNLFLLLASLFFYFSGEPIYTLLLIFSSVSDYLHGLYIEKHRGEKSARIALISAIIINLLMLGVFKYTDFFIETLNSVLGFSIPLLNIRLPIGISFFTFQTMSYTIDVYRGDAHAQKNLSTFATYVCLFPQLIAGPIVRYRDISRELEERKSTLSSVSDGIRRFCVGLGKKVLIANVLGEFCASFTASDEKSVLFYWFNTIFFALQIYFDFSGYSDMAIGLGKMFGFNFPENFNYPFISRSISEFWRRWHMTMGGWFRDYVYIPLGGNRVSGIKWIRNILIVWALTGIWHGAQWNFVLWGVFFGIILALEKLWFGKVLDRLPALLKHVYTLIIIIISFAIFNANGLMGVLEDFRAMFGGANLPFINESLIYNLSSYGLIFAVSVFACTPLPKKVWAKITKYTRGYLEPVFCGVILIISTAFIINGSFNPFLYFRF